jgi:hypothetical protein
MRVRIQNYELALRDEQGHGGPGATDQNRFGLLDDLAEDMDPSRSRSSSDTAVSPQRERFGLLDDLTSGGTTERSRATPPAAPAPPAPVRHSETGPRAQISSSDTAPIATDDELLASMQAWIEQLRHVRTADTRELTPELLAVTGDPPLPPQYGKPIATFAYKFSYSRRIACELADRHSRNAWLEFGAAERADNADAMSDAHNTAQFWKSVSQWFSQL